MALNIFRWIFGDKENADTGTDTGTGTRVAVKDFLDNETDIAMDAIAVYIQRMAFWTAIRKIGDALGAVEWETYRRGKKVKSGEYWAWNYSPNPKQTRQAFMRSLVAQLYLHQEALIVEYHGDRYVADGFSVQKRIAGDIYSDIEVDGEMIPGVFRESDVMHLQINGTRIRNLLNSITAAEGKLLATSTNAYARNVGRRGILDIDEVAEADPDFEETYNELINDKFRRYFTAENAVLPLYKGYKYEEKNSGSAQASTTRDIRALMDDIIEFNSLALGIPASIGTGKSITDKDFAAFMTSPVQPLIKMIETEINRKLYGQSLVFAGTYVSANTSGIRYADLFDVANPIDKLIGSGAFCVNDIRTRLGLDVIDEPWAWQHWMTKNYSSVQDLLTCVDPEGVDINAPAEQGEKEVLDD